MGIFSKNIQATDDSPEGIRRKVKLDSLLYGTPLDTSIPGLVNNYTTYEEQTEAIYEKYNGFDLYGNQQTRAIIDIRSAFIGGEGLSISCKNGATAKWIEKFLSDNLLNGSNFLDAVKASEMAGFSLLALDYKEKDDKKGVKVRRLKYHPDRPIKIKYDDDRFNDTIVQISMKKGESFEPLNIKDYIYVRTGGDDSNRYGPTTRTGIVLTDIENYDRALKDVRRNNHVFARVTPTFEVANESEAKNLKLWLQTIQWKIGTAFIGKAKFKYESPGTAAYENLATEMTLNLKAITAATSVPVHWLGHVDMMSNRSTADSMFETIKNGTISERLTWQEAMYNLILKAMEMDIDNGGELTKLNPDFEVKIPLIDFAGFVDLVRGLSMAYADTAISMDDYRNSLPGIDPLKTEKAVEAEQKVQEEKLVKMGLDPMNQNTEGDSENGGDNETDDETDGGKETD